MARKTASSQMTTNATTAAKMDRKKKVVDKTPALVSTSTDTTETDAADAAATTDTNNNTNNNDAQESTIMTDNSQDTQTQDAPKMHTFTFRKTDTTGRHVYGIPGSVGVILIGHHFLPAEPPATLELPFAGEVKEPKVKLTKEERKAQRDAMTPEQLLEEKRIKLQKQIANLEARKAKLGIQSLPGMEEGEGAEAETEQPETVGAI